MSIQQSKIALRQTLRQARALLAATYRTKAEALVLQHLQASALLQGVQHIGVYYATPEEFPTKKLIEMLWQQDKQVYLPVIQADSTLKFAPYHATTPLQENKFHVREPVAPSTSLAQLDLMLMPLVGFDAACHRLGMGGGFYDRSLASVSPKERPYLLGLAFAQQEVAHIPQEAWDIGLDNILTEHGLLR